MLKIGHFALLSQVPVKTLRYYAEIGLFKPAHVDRFTGYRYYSLDQLASFNRILALKDLGLSLEQIGRSVNEQVSTAVLREMLLTRRTQLQEQTKAVNDELARVEARLRQLEMENTMPDYEIVLKTVEPLRVAARRVYIPTNDEVPDILSPAFDEVGRYLHLHGVRATGPCLAVWHSSADALENEEVEAAFPIGESLPETERIRVYELPQEHAAAVVHHGNFEEFGQAMSAILRWIEDNGYRITGPYRELYIRHDPQNLEESTTEIQFPVEKS